MTGVQTCALPICLEAVVAVATVAALRVDALALAADVGDLLALVAV